MSLYSTDTFIWTGVDRLQAVLANASPRATAFLGAAMEDVMEDVFDQSQNQVPVDTGSLRSSGHLDPASTGPGNITVTIGYGAPYAWFVHENLAAHHPHGKAKYLEDPMRSALGDLTSKLSGRMEAAIVGGDVGRAGSRNHSSEMASMAGRVNKRSLAQRGPMSRQHVEEAMARLRGESHVHPDMRTHFTESRGSLHRSFSAPPAVHFEYDPTRKGGRGDLRWPG